MLLDRTRAAREVRLHEGGIHTLELPALVEELRAEAAYADHGRDGVTLVKTPQQRVLLEVLRAGSGLAEHQAPGPMTLQVLEGELRFACGGEVLYLLPGELLTLPTPHPHSVEAVKDSAFLLTLGPPSAGS